MPFGEFLRVARPQVAGMPIVAFQGQVVPREKTATGMLFGAGTTTWCTEKFGSQDGLVGSNCFMGKVRKMHIDEPGACEAGQDTVDLATQLTFWNEGDDEPELSVAGVQPWECQPKGKGDTSKLKAVEPAR